MICPECYLLLISFLNAHIVVAPADVQLGEIVCIVEIVDKFGDEGEGVAVLDSEGIEHPIILYQMEGAILLFDDEDRGGYR